jgi:ribosomal protein S18 acetylase RimI-like enzyme
MKYKEFTTEDYEAALTLWQATKGVCNCDKCLIVNSKENVEKYLLRNPGMSFVAYEGDKLVGSIFAGHDGRTGLIYRLTVSHDFRYMGIGRTLVEKSVKALQDNGIISIKAMVLNENDDGNAFWEKIGFPVFTRAIMREYEIHE